MNRGRALDRRTRKDRRRDHHDLHKCRADALLCSSPKKQSNGMKRGSIVIDPRRLNRRQLRVEPGRRDCGT
jgi:hypothetical protein